MDIRTAKKGTTPQNYNTPKKEEASTKPTPPEEDKITLDTEEDYDGNLMLQEYMGFLKEHQVTKEDVFKVLDTIMTTGNVEWGCKLFNKIPIRFRMRNSWIEDIISEKIDYANKPDVPLSVARFSNIVRMANLAGSLITYGEQNFPMETEEDYMRSFHFVENLPYPVLAKICDQLAIFDRVIAVAMSDWALKNFTEPQKENS